MLGPLANNSIVTWIYNIIKYESIHKASNKSNTYIINWAKIRSVSYVGCKVGLLIGRSLL